MCQECKCKCCCNYFIFSLFILFGLIGAFITTILICNSFINPIPNYDYFYDNWLNYTKEDDYYYLFYYSNHYKLELIHNEYEKLSDKKNLSSIDLGIHLIILPTFVLLSIIYSFCFVCCKKDYFIFIIFEIFTILIKGVCIIDKVLFELKRQKLSIIDIKYGDNYVDDNSENYIFMSNYYYLIKN